MSIKAIYLCPAHKLYWETWIKSKYHRSARDFYLFCFSTGRKQDLHDACVGNWKFIESGEIRVVSIQEFPDRIEIHQYDETERENFIDWLLT